MTNNYNLSLYTDTIYQTELETTVTDKKATNL